MKVHNCVRVLLKEYILNEIIKSFHYQRDVNGFVIGVLREDEVLNQYYFYDNRLQLQGVIYGDGKTEFYSYDGRGNRLIVEENGQIKEEYQYNIADEITQRRVNYDGATTEYYNYAYQDDPSVMMKFTMNYVRYDRWPFDRTIYREEQSFDYREKMVNYYKRKELYRSGDLWLSDTINTQFSYLPDGLGRVGKRTYSRLKLGTELPPTGVGILKEVFYLNDFFDLLYEKERTRTQRGLNEPEYFESEKYYTMGPGIDFPMIMSYKDTENPDFKAYYYFLNGHRDVVYFADTNFTDELSENYEYNPWGVLLSKSSINTILFSAIEYDFDLNAYISDYKIYYPNLGISFFRSKPASLSYFSKNNASIKKLFSSFYGFQVRSGDYFDPKNPNEGSTPADAPCCFDPSEPEYCSFCCTTTRSCNACCAIHNADCHINCYEICTVASVGTFIIGVIYKAVRFIGFTPVVINPGCLSICFDACDHATSFCKAGCLEIGPY